MTKLADLEARNTAAPINSSSRPKRHIGVRAMHSRPLRAVEQIGIAIGAEDAGSDRVHAPAMPRPFGP